jgi:DNA invertase Pin-like site-specific DNA recombinase
MPQKKTMVAGRELMKRAAIYARYSSDKQNERSIDDQVAFCRVIAERAHYQVSGSIATARCLGPRP